MKKKLLLTIPFTGLIFFSTILFAEEPENQLPPEQTEQQEETTEAEETEKESSDSGIISVIYKGGYTMVGLAIISTIILGFALERFFFFRRQKTETKGFYDELEKTLSSGGIEALEKQLAEDDRILARILKEALKHKSAGAARVEKAIENTASVEVGKLERGLNLLSNLGNLAPLLGFFGTVVGMRTSFLQFVEKAAPTARDLAVGVEEALITTAAGLLIAIPTYLIYNLFIYRIDSITIELERCSAELLSYID